jgi:hypothetical protein
VYKLNQDMGRRFHERQFPVDKLEKTAAVNPVVFLIVETRMMNSYIYKKL